jgi:hypothetical protein
MGATEGKKRGLALWQEGFNAFASELAEWCGRLPLCTRDLAVAIYKHEPAGLLKEIHQC